MYWKQNLFGFLGAYMGLNQLGYEHYTVTHKTTFKQRYENVETGEVVECHTNQIEGAWKHCKDHFRKMNGTNTCLFEQHLAEIVWRNHVHNKNKYVAFFDLVKSIYTLDKDAKHTYPTPLFQTWTTPTKVTEQQHHVTILQGSESETDTESDDAPESPIASSTRIDIEQDVQPESPTRLVLTSTTQPPGVEQDSEGFSPALCTEDGQAVSTAYGVQVSSPVSTSAEPSTSTHHIDDRHVTSRKKKPTKITPSKSVPPEKLHTKTAAKFASNPKKGKKLCYPKQCQPLPHTSRKSPETKKRQSNPYSKSHFVYDFSSSDSDFQ